MHRSVPASDLRVSQAVLLVGGEGTRLRPLTYRRPKALIPLLNRPLLSFELSLLARHGIRDVILAVGYKAGSLQDELGDGSQWGVRLTYVEDPAPLGTAGAIGNVRHLLRSDFVAMNGDLVYDADLGGAIAEHISFGAAVTFCLRKVPDIRRFGLIQCDDDGWVQAFREKQECDETGRNTVNSGLYIMSPGVLDAIPKGQAYSNEHDLFPGLLTHGARMRGFVAPSQGYWADVGTLESYLQTDRDLLAGAVPWVKGEVSPHTHIAGNAVLVGPVDIAPGCRIEPGATVGPHVSLGAGCVVGAGAAVRNAILWDHVTVGAGAKLSDVVVADGVMIAECGQHAGGVMDS
jgi:NDP-sugar pyrophosphorylase family protein